eukprot:343240-Alexandrium_andersonii.AAC.1
MADLAQLDPDSVHQVWASAQGALGGPLTRRPRRWARRWLMRPRRTNPRTSPSSLPGAGCSTSTRAMSPRCAVSARPRRC